MNNYIKRFLAANRDNLPFVLGATAILFLFIASKFLGTIFTNPGIFLKIPLLLISIILHEVAHGYAAYLSGDNTAKYMGRLTLNPLKHIDLFGFLLPILLIVTGSNFIIGWAKPVPVNYYNLKNGRLGEFYISIAGVLTNFFLAFIGILLLKFFSPFFIQYKIITYLVYFVQFNVMIGIFNLLPIPPLDGSKLIASFATEKIRTFIFSMERYGFFLIIFLAWSGVLSLLISPLYYSIIKIFQFFL